jgi:hypothetical protein
LLLDAHILLSSECNLQQPVGVIAFFKKKIETSNRTQIVLALVWLFAVGALSR